MGGDRQSTWEHMAPNKQQAMCSTHRDIWWPAWAHQQDRDIYLVSRRPSATSGLHSSGCASSLHPSVRLHLGPLSLHHGLPDPCLRLGHRSHQLCLGPLDPPCRPGSSALQLFLGLHHHLLRRHRPLESSALAPPWLLPSSCLSWIYPLVD